MVYRVLFTVFGLGSLFCLPGWSIAISYPETTLAPMYAKLFGSQDASPFYQNAMCRALSDFRVQQPEQVPVKHMGSLAPTLMGPLCSFTMIGIWLNEELLDSCTAAERTFLLYHEAAHYARHHHARFLLYILLASFGTRVVSLSQRLMIPSFGTLADWALWIGLIGIYDCALMRYWLRPLVKLQEKEADIEAVAILCATGQIEVVQKYLEQLKEIVAQGNGNLTDGWHPTVAQQVNYLTQALVLCVSSTAQ